MTPAMDNGQFMCMRKLTPLWFWGEVLQAEMVRG